MHNLLVLRMELRRLLSQCTHRNALRGYHSRPVISITVANSALIQLLDIDAALGASYLLADRAGIRVSLPLFLWNLWLDLD